ncbi:hypothetical protein ACLOJK_013394 [Asimina triloba]
MELPRVAAPRQLSWAVFRLFCWAGYCPLAAHEYQCGHAWPGPFLPSLAKGKIWGFWPCGTNI